MHRFVLLALLLSGVARAGERVDRVLGWTRDGRCFAYASTEENARPTHLKPGATPTDADDAPQHLLWRSVLDTRTGEVQRYLLDYQNLEDAGSGGAKLASDWVAWSTAHPLARAPLGPSGPGGARAVVQRCDDGAPGIWTDGKMALDGPSPCVNLGVDLRGKRWWTAHAQLPAPALSTPDWSLQVAWSTDGTRVVWLIEDEGNPESGGTVHAVPSSLTSHVEVRVPPSLKQTAGPRVVAALLGAKAGALLEATALQDPERTVVRSGPKHSDLAKRLAAAIPGGATVEPAAPEANGDVVVTVGTSAAPSAPGL